ncbi:hypothetical protein [Desulfosoma sp.]|uniref:hypothetical protein n=1 Tax=Desulfosoma sp. TaxID=2603217 RepID=UPI00404B7E38
MNFRALQNALMPLSHPPLHPQWMVFRERNRRRESISGFARGRVQDIGCGDRWVEGALAAHTSYIGLDYPATKRKGYPGLPDVYADGQSLPLAQISTL